MHSRYQTRKSNLGNESVSLSQNISNDNIMDGKNSSSGSSGVITATGQTIQQKHLELCRELNMDREAVELSWKSYKQVTEDHGCEGEPIHWLCCALYMACRHTKTPTVGRPGAVVEGNCVSLTRLLRSCKLTFLEFFNKMKHWMDMVNASKEFRDRIERLRINLLVSLVVYQHFQAISKDLFVGIQSDEPRKSKKSTRSLPCTPKKLYEFCWYLFVCAKSEYPENSEDLVTTFHMLLCCIDLIFANAIDENRTDIINPKCEAIPIDWCKTDATSSGSSSSSTSGLVEHTRRETPSKRKSGNSGNGTDDANKSDIKKPICIMSMLCSSYDGTLIDAMRTKLYTWNSVISKYVRKGELKCTDQFLGLISVENFETNLQSLKKKYEEYVLSVGEIDEGILLAQIENSALNQTLKKQYDESRKQLMPDTPLTRRNCLPGKESNMDQVKLAVKAVHKLRNQLSKYDGKPPATLCDLLSKVSEDPFPRIKQMLSEMEEKFRGKFETNSHERFQLAEAVYYQMLENILRNEMTPKKSFDWKIVHMDMFHTTLIACSVEIVIYAYSNVTQKKFQFPWILSCFSLDAYNFYKIIEMIVLNHRDLLTRDVIKHLNAIEEQCIDSLVWTSSSPLWKFIESSENVPGWQDADLPKHLQFHINNDLAGVTPHSQNFERNLLQSPFAGALDRFHQLSPPPVPPPTSAADTVSKQLFKPTGRTSTSSNKSTNNNNNNNSNNNDELSGGGGGSGSGTSNKNNSGNNSVSGRRSLNLFFRKFYKLAYLRMAEICGQLNYKDEKCLQKIWTIFEYSITTQYHLMRDRHLDQLLMCAIYVFGRNAKFTTKFRDVMHSYRKVFCQVTSDVYRDVHMTEADKQNATGEDDPNKKTDIITFYNICYVRSMQDFVTKETGILSPLPAITNQSPRKVSEHHSLYIQPFEPRELPQSPNALTYSFKSSPIEDLSKINRIVQQQEIINSNGKRILPFSAGSGSEMTGHMNKLIRLTTVANNESNINNGGAEAQPYIREKLQKIITDRHLSDTKNIKRESN